MNLGNLWTQKVIISIFTANQFIVTELQTTACLGCPMSVRPWFYI